jgi:hypothetical protein
MEDRIDFWASENIVRCVLFWHKKKSHNHFYQMLNKEIVFGKKVIEFKLDCTHLAFNNQNSCFESSFMNYCTVYYFEEMK